MLLFLFILLLSITIIRGEVVLSSVQIVYESSPQLKIKGSGFGDDEHRIYLNIVVDGIQILVADRDYMITKVDDGIVLKLLAHRK